MLLLLAALVLFVAALSSSGDALPYRSPKRHMHVVAASSLAARSDVSAAVSDSSHGSSSRISNVEKYRSRSIAIEAALKRIMELSSKYTSAPSQQSISNTSLLVESPSEDSTLDIIHGLKRSYCKWKSLPLPIQTSLMQLVTETIFMSNSSTCNNIIDTIWCLGKIRFDYKCSGAHFRRGINIAVSGRVGGGGGIAKLLHGLSQINFGWAGAERATQEALFAALVQQLPSMNELEVVNSVYALGKIGVSWGGEQSSRSRPVLDALLLAVERVAPSMDAVGLANTIWGLGKADTRWQGLPRSTQAALAAQFQRLGNRLGPHAVSSALVGLVGMHSTWPLLQNSIRNSIETSIIRASVSEMNEQTVSMTLWGLAALKANRGSVQQQCFTRLFEGFVSTGGLLTSQGLCSALYGLSVLGWGWEELPAQVTVTFESFCVNSKSGRMHEQSAANLIYSLGRMRAQWHGSDRGAGGATVGRVLGRRACASLSTIAERNICTMTEQGVCNTLLGLAKMGASWCRLQPRLRYSVSLSLTGVMGSMTPQGVSNTLWSLSVMGVEWDRDLDEHHHLSQILADRLCTLALGDSLSNQALATSIHSLSKMGACYSSLPTELQRSLESSLAAQGGGMSPLEVSNTVYGLGRMNVAMRSLSEDVQGVIFNMTSNTCESMNEQELGSTVWGLVGQMGVGYSGLPPDLGAGLRAAVLRSTLTQPSVVALLQGLARARDVTWRDLPSDMKGKFIESVLSILVGRGGESGEHAAASGSKERRGDRVLFCSIVLLMFGKLGVRWSSADLLLQAAPSASSETDAAIIFDSSPLDIRTAMLDLFEDFASDLQGGGEPLEGARPGRVVSNFFTGFVMAAGSWDELEPRVQSLLRSCAASSRVLAALNCNELATTLWSMGRLGFVLSSLQPGQWQALMQRLETELPRMTAYEVTWTLWSLGQLSLPYIAVSEPLRAAVVAALSKQIGAMSRNDVGVVLWALDRMRADFNDMPLALREAVNAKLFLF